MKGSGSANASRANIRVTLGILGVLVSLYVLFTFEPPSPTALWSTLLSAGHAPLFGVIAISFLLVARGHAGTWANSRAVSYWIAFGGAALLGAGTELLQLLDPQRNASWLDWLRDLAGAAAFLMTAAAFDRRLGAGTVWRRCGIVLPVLLLAAVAAPVVAVLHAYQQRSAAFPVLADFDSSWQRAFLETREADLVAAAPSAGWPADGPDTVARLTFPPGRYPGLSINEPYPDWTGRTRFVMEAYSLEPMPVNITLRVHDQQHNHQYDDRFNRTLEVHPGHNLFAVPLDEIRAAPHGRELDLRRVAGIIIFAFENERSFTMEIGPLVLQ